MVKFCTRIRSQALRGTTGIREHDDVWTDEDPSAAPIHLTVDAGKGYLC